MQLFWYKSVNERENLWFTKLIFNPETRKTFHILLTLFKNCLINKKILILFFLYMPDFFSLDFLNYPNSKLPKSGLLPSSGYTMTSLCRKNTMSSKFMFLILVIPGKNMLPYPDRPEIKIKLITCYIILLV